ncbi:MAG TPA: Qat anti-phage system TatD family nuclease QatD [Terriglobales bacterium]|nr:Qat anti-phage system TatD family nuclease QatD [Terriglobales bacterium]
MIDFHVHLDLYPEPASVVQRCTELGIYVLSVTTTPTAWERTAALAAGSPRIRTALGLHPQLAQQRKHELTLFRELVNTTQYIGEVGLDGSPDCKAFWNDQVDAFHEILHRCSLSGGKVLSIHSRRAVSDVLKCLLRYPSAGTPVMHWFAGSHKELKDAIDSGCWFSVGPAMLHSAKSREQIAMMPHNRVLTESDGPFTQHEGQRLYPWDANLALDSLASIWGKSADEVKVELHQNLRRLGASVLEK